MFDLQKVGHGHVVQFSQITQFDGKRQNRQMSPTHFCASSNRFRYIQITKNYLQKVGQDHGVQFSQLHHSMANVNINKSLSHFWARTYRFPEININVLHLVHFKCIPVLLYGLDACPINATDFKSLQHPITNIFMKLFAAKSAEVVTEYQQAFGFQSIRNQINCRKITFLNRYVTSLNCILCTITCNWDIVFNGWTAWCLSKNVLG